MEGNARSHTTDKGTDRRHRHLALSLLHPATPPAHGMPSPTFRVAHPPFFWEKPSQTHPEVCLAGLIDGSKPSYDDITASMATPPAALLL